MSTSTTGNTTTDSAQAESSIASMKKLMLETKVDGGNKSIWTMTKETLGMADGKTKKGDIIVDTVDIGVELLSAYVEQRESTMEPASAGASSLLGLVPLEEFQATKEQFFTAFLKWAEKEDETTGAVKINVSKAQRRMDAYFEFMKDNQKDFEEPLTVASIAAAAKVWDIQITYDEKGHLVWWIDLGSLDKNNIKNMSPSEHLRYVVWFSHFVMFDAKAQENGAMIVEDLGMIGFWKMATLLPHELSAKMDRLTIGILPVKMKKIYVFGAATWMSLLMALMKPFMGKKMRERMIVLPSKIDIQTFCDELVTRKNIPVGFSGLEGETPRDAVFAALK
eukprot:Nitzschia sp. Nitz4//scaffold238_size30058//3147//4154//NITZ4_007998-RA/size30058-processed-gene-0.59-mRNA-1//-1//CDS//3329543525//4543//frame0